MMKNKLLYIIMISPILNFCLKNTDLTEVNYEELNPKTMETNLLILNIEVDQSEFDVMYENYNDDIDVNGFLSGYRNGNEVIIDREVEIEIKGRTTNELSLKSIGVEFVDVYDNSSRFLLNPNKILPWHSLDEIETFRLRNSGNDIGLTMIKDLCYHELAINANLKLDPLYGEQTVVFINDSFLGLMNLRTETNADGISRLFNQDDDEISLIEIYQKGLIIPKKDHTNLINPFIQAIENNDLNYLKEHTDLDNFTEYVIFETLVSNFDWPHNNVRLFAFPNMPFRFVLFDLDLCNTTRLAEDPMSFIAGFHENPITDLFEILYDDPEFKANFDLRFEALIDSDVFSPEKFESIVDKNAANIEDVINFQIDKHALPYSKIEWYRQIEILKDNYRERMKYFD